MIANERQYRVTQARAAEFVRAITDLDARPDDDDPRLRGMMRAGMAEQLAELQAEIADYEALRDGRVTVLEHVSLDRLGVALIQARIAAGLTQRELAERLGRPEQQIQRYEQTQYDAASLRRLRQVADALGVRIESRLLLPLVEQPVAAAR